MHEQNLSTHSHTEQPQTLTLDPQEQQAVKYVLEETLAWSELPLCEGEYNALKNILTRIS